MKLEEYIEVIKKFLKDYLESSHMDGYVLGISGGIDSAVAARLIQESVGNDKLFCLMMPCHSQASDLDDGLKFANKFNLNYRIVDLTSSYDEMKKVITAQHPLNGLADHNVKVRLRMTTLFAVGQERKSLVIGTDNWDENFVGYFTKYGDGAADLLPLVRLTKHEVYEVGRILGVNEEILNKAPTAGLFDGQTDEKEMGITYDELDSYLLGEEVNEVSKAKIERLHRISEHKRIEIPRPIEFNRK